MWPCYCQQDHVTMLMQARPGTMWPGFSFTFSSLISLSSVVDMLHSQSVWTGQDNNSQTAKEKRDEETSQHYLPYWICKYWMYLKMEVFTFPHEFRRNPADSERNVGILMESRWLKPQPFWFPIPLKFQWNPTESDGIWWKQPESGSLREQFPLESIGIPTRFHGIPMESIFQLNSNGIRRNPLEYGYSSEIPTNSDRFQ